MCVCKFIPIKKILFIFLSVCVNFQNKKQNLKEKLGRTKKKSTTMDLFRKSLNEDDSEFVQFMLLSYATSDTPVETITEYSMEEQCMNGDLYEIREEDESNYRADKKTTDFHLILFGRTIDGFSVAFDIKFWPCLVVDIPSTWTVSMAEKLYKEMLKQYKIPEGVSVWEMQKFHPTAGFYPDVTSSEPKIAVRPFLIIWCKSIGYFYTMKHFFDNKVVELEAVGRRKYDCIEVGIPPVLQFIESCKSKPCAIMRVPRVNLQVSRRQKFSHCDLEYHCAVRHYHGGRIPFEFVDSDDLYPVVILSFDIEVRSAPNRFPEASNPENQVISICSTSKNMKTGETISSIHALQEFQKLEGNPSLKVQEWFEKESELLESFRDYIVFTVDPDITTGYNIHNFDWPYLNDRAQLLCGPTSRFWHLSRLVKTRCRMETKEFSSKAFGASGSREFTIPGRVDVDLYTYVKRNYKFKNYKLGYVSRNLLGKEKDDLTILEMNQCHDSNDPLRRQRVHEYCLMDTLLPLDIWVTQYILESMVEMSRVTYVFLSDLFSRGQSFKVLCQLYIFARANRYMLDKLPDFSHLESYQGATVLEMKTGYMKDVVVLDFASLYPSVMQALNLCYTSWVREEKFDNLPGWSYNTQKTDIGEFRWQTTIPGLLPQMVASLGKSRKLAKQKMNMAHKAGDTSGKIIFNARQLALKISTNSIYGFTGAAKMGKYACPPIAATTTCYGRFLIGETKRRIEERFAAQGADCVYGDTDSVMILFRNIPNTEEGYQQVHHLGEEAAHMISNAFHPAIILENEKTYRKVIMLKKKNYVAKSQEHPGEPAKLDVKGVMMVRRDFSEFQQQVYSKVIFKLLDDEDPIGGLHCLEDAFTRLLAGEVSLDDLTLSKQLAKTYKNANNQQKVVADKIEKRSPGSGPQPGDRVAYVPIVVPNSDNVPLYQRVECVKYVKENNVQVNHQYFIESFSSSMEDLFDAFQYQNALQALIHQFTHLAKAKMGKCRSVLEFFPREDKNKKKVSYIDDHAQPQAKKQKMTKSDKEKEQKKASAHALKMFSKVFGTK